jgi:probable HAF family extracellular repeat protein
MTPLGTLPGDYASEAHDINAHGHIAGSSTGLGGGWPTIYSDGAWRNIGAGVSGVAFALNDHGHAVGGGNFGDGGGAALWKNGTVVNLGHFPAPSPIAAAYDINNSGQIVGFSANPAGNYSAWVSLDQRTITDLNTLIAPGSGWRLQYAHGINEAGQIAGYGTLNGLTRAFLLTPITPPSLPGDANRDGSVNGTDFALLAGNFGVLSGADWSRGDFNGDGAVNGTDFALLAGNFGRSAGGAALAEGGVLALGSQPAALPEPSAVCMLLGLPVVLLRRVRARARL